jgi:16S rRNA C1402 N4-methylase RsmH
MKHVPVLLDPIMSIIKQQYKPTIIDATFGEGHYTRRILGFCFERLNF